MKEATYLPKKNIQLDATTKLNYGQTKLKKSISQMMVIVFSLKYGLYLSLPNMGPLAHGNKFQSTQKTHQNNLQKPITQMMDIVFSLKYGLIATNI